jgi:hypothetical protein
LDFNSPATAEVLRLACQDNLVKKSAITPKLIQTNTNESGETVEQYEKLFFTRL